MDDFHWSANLPVCHLHVPPLPGGSFSPAEYRTMDALYVEASRTSTSERTLREASLWPHFIIFPDTFSDDYELTS